MSIDLEAIKRDTQALRDQGEPYLRLTWEFWSALVAEVERLQGALDRHLAWLNDCPVWAETSWQHGWNAAIREARDALVAEHQP